MLPYIITDDKLEGVEKISSQVELLSLVDKKIFYRDILLNFLLIFFCLYYFYNNFNILTWLLLAPIVSCRSVAIAALAHDLSHCSQYFPKSNFDKFIKNLIQGFLPRTPFNIYKKIHLDHHRFLNTPKDPHFELSSNNKHIQFPIGKWMLILDMLKALGGIKLFSYKKELFLNSKRKMILAPIKIGSLLLLSYMMFETTRPVLCFLLLYILPNISFTVLIHRIASTSEHSGTKHVSNFMQTRSVHPCLLERFFLFPCNVSRHVEHHLYPSIPYYNLKKLSDLLIKETDFAEKVPIYTGFFFGKRKVITDLVK